MLDPRMKDNVALLPSFERPPLGEVALVTQFNPITKIRNLDYFRLWSQSKFKELYPSVGEYVELPDFREEFGDDAPATTSFLPTTWEPVARYNFRSDERKEQIQIQRTRIGFYWHAGSDAYPRFPSILEKFRRDYVIFDDFVNEHKSWGGVIPDQCAISYSNAIFKGQGWERPEDLQNVITFWRNEFSRPRPGNAELENSASILHFVVSENNKKVARLYVTATIIPRSVDIPEHLELQLVFRGPPPTSDLNGVTTFFALGRNYIVTTFEAVTTQAMHELWGKR